MPGAYRYSASLDKAYRDDEVGPIRLSGDLDSQNGNHNRTCSMDSLDSISSSAGSLAGSSSCSGSGGAHSRQVSTDSTSSPTNFTSQPSSFISNRMGPPPIGKASHNPHQFIKAGPSSLHKSATEQIKVVKEVVKTFRSPVKEDEEEWQQNLCSWKSKRRTMSEKTIQRVDEMKQLETVDDVTGDSIKKKNKTFSQMCQDKARRPSYNLSIYSESRKESEESFSEEITNTKENISLESKLIEKEHDSSFDDNNIDDLFNNSIKDKDDGYSSKDECNRTEADDQSDIAIIDDQMSMMTESSGVSEREISTSFTQSVLEAYPENNEDKLEMISSSATSSEEDFNSTAFHDSDDAEDVNSVVPDMSSIIEEETDSEMRPGDVTNHNDDLHQHTQSSDNTHQTIILTLKCSSDVKEFGFTIKGGSDVGSHVFVESIVSNGAAEKAGLLVGDYIVSINGEKTVNRSHTALVFAVKQAVYTGQLQLDILRNLTESDLQIPEVPTPKKPSSEKAFNEIRAAFLQKEKEENAQVKAPVPTRDTVSRRRSMFDNLASQEMPRPAFNIARRTSLRDRVASFENINDSTYKKSEKWGSVENVKIPPLVKPKPVVAYEQKPIFTGLSKESLLSQPDLIETSIDSSSSSDKEEQQLEDVDNVMRELDEEMIIKEEVMDEVQRSCWATHPAEAVDSAVIEQEVDQECVRSHVTIPKNELEQLCNQLDEVAVTAEVNVSEPVMEVIPDDNMKESTSDDETAEGNQTVLSGPELVHSNLEDVTMNQEESVDEIEEDDEGCVEDVSNALDEALALFDDSEPSLDDPIAQNSVDISSKNEETEKWISSNVDTFQANDINIIFDSSTIPSENPFELYNQDDCFVDENFDRPRSIAEPPKEKPPPPPVEAEPSQKTPPMKRINSTKRIKKEIWRRRSDFLGLGNSQEDTVDVDEPVVKPRRQIEDLLRSELEMEKNLPSPTFSSDYSQSSYEHPCSEFECVQQENGGDELGGLECCDDNDEEEHIRLIEERRIQMQQARQKAEEDRLLQERVEQMRKQQEMLIIEKERMRREQDEVLKARRNSVSSVEMQPKDAQQMDNALQGKYSRSKSRPRAPPPPPPKPKNSTGQPSKSFSPSEQDRSEVIRLSKRPTSGDFGDLEMFSIDSRPQPIQKQPLSRHSLQSLSAVPKANSNSDSYWMKKDVAVTKKRADVPRRDTYSHWLIQEAEMRRIAEHTERHRSDKHYRGNGNPLSYSKSETNIARVGNQCIQDPAGDRYMYSANSNPSSHEWSQRYQQHAKSKSVDIVSYSSSVPHGDANQEHYTCGDIKNSPPPNSNYNNSVPPVVASPDAHSYNYIDNDQVVALNQRLQYSDPNMFTSTSKSQNNMLSVSGRKKCSNCNDELGRGAAMIIESLKLFYHIKCFRCSVCQVQLGNGSCGADVRVRNHKLHCQNCYSNDEAGLKFSKV